MQSRAVLDFVGLPVHAPGHLEARLRRVHVREDGSVVDDGSRSGQSQTGCHRFVAAPGSNIARIASPSIGALGAEGYVAPDLALLRLIGRHEWRRGVLSARRGYLAVTRPELRLVVRALGFDVVGAGELALGLGLATVTPRGAQLTAKSGIKLLPGDPLDLVFEALGELADRLGCQPLCAEDVSLVRAVAAHLWTPAAVAAREAAWLDWQAAQGIPMQIGAALELAERLAVPDFQPLPIGAAGAQPMRTLN